MARIQKQKVTRKVPPKKVAAAKSAVFKKPSSAAKKSTAKITPSKAAGKSSRQVKVKKVTRKKTLDSSISKKTAAAKKAPETKSRTVKKKLTVQSLPKTKMRKAALKTTRGSQVRNAQQVLGGLESPLNSWVGDKFSYGHADQPRGRTADPEIRGELPSEYGDHFIHLMIVSPYQIYAYWEVQKDKQLLALESLGGSWEQIKSVLRVHQCDLEKNESSFYDLELVPGALKWFIGVDPDKSYFVEIGLLNQAGNFAALAASNCVTTPRVRPSDVVDEDWDGLDAVRMYALSGGFDPNSSAEDLQKMMEARLRDAVTSGSGAGMMSSGSLVKNKNETRDFWFSLNCELIVYGATRPDAQVTMNGQQVQLRPDGTFTLRYALPDGKIRLEAKAFSADQIETRTITPTVLRSTERPEPVIRPARVRG